MNFNPQYELERITKHISSQSSIAEYNNSFRKQLVSFASHVQRLFYLLSYQVDI
jgi:hypothetical protein